MPACSDQLARWAARQFDSTGASIDRLVAHAVKEFGRDPDWIKAFVLEQFREEITRGVTGRAMRAERGGETSGEGDRAPAPSRPVPAIDPDKAPARRRIVAAARSSATPAWAKTLAIDPDRRTFRPMLSLTREELLDGSHYLAGRAALCAAIAERLQPGQRVRDVFTEEGLTELIKHHTPPAIAG